MKFLKCNHCGNIIAYVEDKGVPVFCCGEKMHVLETNVNAAPEKHLPIITQSDNTVTVTLGAAAHPMTDEHLIQWIALETNYGNQRKVLAPGVKPFAVFEIIEGEQVLAAYAYCNLHGLWKTENK